MGAIAVISWRMMKAVMCDIGAVRSGVTKRLRKRGSRDSIRSTRDDEDALAFVAYLLENLTAA